MKQKSIFSKLACTALCLSPLLLSGCQGGGLFGQSPRYDGVDPYARSGAYQRGDRYATTRSATTVTTTKGLRATNRRMPTSSSAAVPVQHPTVQNSTNRRVKRTTTTTTTTNAAVGSNVVTSPGGPSTGMVVPNVGQ
ncbi:MAG: hypothetical protein H0U57_11520 [Tatlockia sp.]|nr:hypothetical protein [Tatlockia sp.]